MYLNRDYRVNENQSNDKTETIDSNIFSGICGSIESGRKVSRSYSNVQMSTERSEIRLIMKTTHFWLAKDGHTFKTRTHSEWFSRPHEQQGWRKRARNRLLLMLWTVSDLWGSPASLVWRTQWLVRWSCYVLLSPAYQPCVCRLLFSQRDLLLQQQKNNTNYRHGFCGVFFTVLFPSYQR